jgi:protein CpxP
MNKKFIVLFSFLFALASTNSKDSKAHCGCHGHHGMHEKLYKKLNLSTEQKAKIKEIRMKNHEKMHANYQQLKAVKKQLRALAHNPQLDKATLNSLTKQKTELQAKLTKNRVVMHHEIYNLLNEKQKAELQAMKQKHHKAA